MENNNVMDAINDLVNSVDFENTGVLVEEEKSNSEDFLDSDLELDSEEVSLVSNGFESLSVSKIVDKKIVRDIFRIYDNEFELNKAFDGLLKKATEYGDAVLETVRDNINYYADKYAKRTEKLAHQAEMKKWHEDIKLKREMREEERRRWRSELDTRREEDAFKRMKWHEEVQARKEAEARLKEERRLTRLQMAELSELNRAKLEEQRKKEWEQSKAEFINTLDPEVAEDIINNKLVFKNNGELNQASVMNYDLIIQNDIYLKDNLRFNEFTNNLEWDGNHFTNGDLLNIISYMDRVYKIHDEKLIWNSLNRPGNVERYHPIKDIIEYDEWDGTPRIDDFFQKVCNVSITDTKSRTYYREVARMLFYGGIKRLYEPGCKFDYMIILEGRQGTCKTTLVRMLALDDSAYSEVTSIDGAVGVESISGAWICELAELLAMVRAREVESIKAFVTRQFDKYRAPYARVSEVIPRSCIFIGTTNEIQFMGDMTGNRRYLPVEVHTDATEFFNNLEENKKYILECWREAFHLYLNGKIYTTISSEHFDLLENVRDTYVEDNPTEGLIRDYIDSLPVGYELCGLEIYTRALNMNRSKFSARDSRMIATVMSKCPNWIRCTDRKSFIDEGYGRQRYWKKVGE